MDFDKVKLTLHIGGQLVRYPKVEYIGGIKETFVIDLDYVSYKELLETVEDVGPQFGRVEYFAFLAPCYEDGDGLIEVQSDDSIRTVINIGRIYGAVDLFVIHVITQADEVYFLTGTEVGENLEKGLNADEGVNGLVGGEIVSGPVEDSNGQVDEDKLEVDESSSSESEVGSLRSEDIFDENKYLYDDYDDEVITLKKKKANFKKNRVDGSFVFEEKELETKTAKAEGRTSVAGCVAAEEGKVDSDDTDYLEEEYFGSDEVDSKSEVRIKKSRRVWYDPKKRRIECGMYFTHRDDLKEALSEYAIERQFCFIYKKNDAARTRVICKAEGCPFLLYAALDDEGYLQVRNFKEKHSCTVVYENKRVNYRYIGKKFLNKIRIIPNLKLHQMKKLAREEKHSCSFCAL